MSQLIRAYIRVWFFHLLLPLSLQLLCQKKHAHLSNLLLIMNLEARRSCFDLNKRNSLSPIPGQRFQLIGLNRASAHAPVSYLKARFLPLHEFVSKLPNRTKDPNICNAIKTSKKQKRKKINLWSLGTSLFFFNCTRGLLTGHLHWPEGTPPRCHSSCTGHERSLFIVWLPLFGPREIAEVGLTFWWASYRKLRVWH